MVSSEPWNKVIWNPITHKMVMRNQLLVKYLFMHMYDHNILTPKEKNALRTKFALVHNVTVQEANDMLNNIYIQNA
jgi:DNA sulfur modification protein DndB